MLFQNSSLLFQVVNFCQILVNFFLQSNSKGLQVFETKLVMSTITLAEHHLLMKHQIDWDSATCIMCSTDYYQCFTLES